MRSVPKVKYSEDLRIGVNLMEKVLPNTTMRPEDELSPPVEVYSIARVVMQVVPAVEA